MNGDHQLEGQYALHPSGSPSLASWLCLSGHRWFVMGLERGRRAALVSWSRHHLATPLLLLLLAITEAALLYLIFWLSRG